MYKLFVNGALICQTPVLEASIEAALHVRRVVNVESVILVTKDDEKVLTIDVKEPKNGTA